MVRGGQAFPLRLCRNFLLSCRIPLKITPLPWRERIEVREIQVQLFTPTPALPHQGGGEFIFSRFVGDEHRLRHSLQRESAGTGRLTFVPVKEIVRMDVAVNRLTMTVNMLMDEIYPEQKILVSENFIHPSYFLDAVFF